MYLEPKNRHLLVLPLNREEEEKNLIILPDDYKQPKDPYITCDILGVAGDCSIDVSIGDLIVVESSMIHEIKAMGETNYLVLENYVYGRLQDE
jgi:hypothetical protein